MNSSITEELFFTGLIGNVSIDSIIPYILKMETAEYNSQDSDPTEWHPITRAAPRTVSFKDGTLSLCHSVGLLLKPSPKSCTGPLFSNDAWCKLIQEFLVG